MRILPDKVDFFDYKDKAAYRGLISKMRNAGIEKFEMTITAHQGKMTVEKQAKLWNVVVSLISIESGHTKREVEETLNETGKTVNDMSHKEFSDLMEHTFSIVETLFSLRLAIDNNGNIIKL